MACCIYAVLLVKTLLSPILWIYERVFALPHSQGSSASAWTPSADVATAQALASAGFAVRPNQNKHGGTR